MSGTVKRFVSSALAAIMVIVMLAAVLPVRASADSVITYSISYSGSYVRLTLTPKTASDTIYYTVDGSKPTTSSKKYTKTLAATAKVTIRAVEYNKNGSAVASIKATIAPRVQTPSITAYRRTDGTMFLTMTSATSGAKIYYTTDGSTPTTSSAAYTGNLDYKKGTTVKARAFKENMAASQIAEFFISDVSEAEQVIAIVNAERNAAGKSSLVMSEKLMQAADERARELEALFSHTRPDGRSCETVLAEYGVSFMACGENIAYGMNTLYTAKEAMEGWMNSSGHRANILSGNFGKIGVGRFTSGNRVYWVQIFTD